MVRPILACLLVLTGCAVATSPSAPEQEETPIQPEAPQQPEASGEPQQPEASSEPQQSEASDEPDPAVARALSVPHDMPPLDTPCETRRAFATGRVARALEVAAQGCSADADCVKASRSTGCRGGCPTAVSKTYADRYETLRESIDVRVCTGYREDGCPYATPRCATGSPRCVEGSCTYVMAAG